LVEFLDLVNIVKVLNVHEIFAAGRLTTNKEYNKSCMVWFSL